jgi:hypothetical protein
MKMPKWAKLQKAHKRPPRNEILSTLGSPFILWILTAIFLTIGGSYFTKRQECLQNTRSDINQFLKMTIEITHRRTRLLAGLETSSNPIDFLKVVRSNSYSSYKDFDGQTLESLVFERERLFPKINSRSVMGLVRRNPNDGRSMLYDLLQGGIFVKGYTDSEFQSMKADPLNNPSSIISDANSVLSHQYVPIAHYSRFHAIFFPMRSSLT